MVLHYLANITQPPLVPNTQTASPDLFFQGYIYRPLRNNEVYAVDITGIQYGFPNNEDAVVPWSPRHATHPGLILPRSHLGSFIPIHDLAELNQVSPEAEQITLYINIYIHCR